MPREYSAGGVVFRKKGGRIEFALIKDSYGRYGLPKGHIEKGETKRGTALRETLEEMGCQKRIMIAGYLGKINYRFKNVFDKRSKKGTLVAKTVFYYLMEAPGDIKCIPQKEEGIQEIVWVKPEELLKIADYKNNTPILRKALRKLKDRH